MKANISRSLDDSIMGKGKRPVRLSLIIACLLALASLASAAGKSANMPTVNPYLHNSFNPISHENPAQTDAVDIASGSKGRTLGADDAKVLYTDIETSHHVLKNIGDKQVAYFSGAGVAISKVDVTGENFKLIHRTMLPGHEAEEKNLTPGVKALLKKVDAAQAALDEKAILGLTDEAVKAGFKLENFTNATYKMIDKDGFLFTIMGAGTLLKYTDDNKFEAPLRLVKKADLRDSLPKEIAKGVSRIIGIGMTYDGHLAVVAPGVITVLDRDFKLMEMLPIPGEAVDNNIAIDESGIYVVTSKRMLKAAWNGTKLSIDEKDGGWSAGYNNMDPKAAIEKGAISRGSGTTPALMGFGDDEDKLVIIADADEKGTNLVAYWRDEIPASFKQKPGTVSRRIADQISITVSFLTIEPSPNVLGYDVAVLNTSYPDPVKANPWGNALLSGLTRKPPLGIEKFRWNPVKNRLERSWTNYQIDNSDIGVGVISVPNRMLYTVHRDAGKGVLVGIDWDTGIIKSTWRMPTDSAIWGSYGNIISFAADGDMLAGGLFGIKRWNIGQDN
jgi:hypothetical protein